MHAEKVTNFRRDRWSAVRVSNEISQKKLRFPFRLYSV